MRTSERHYDAVVTSHDYELDPDIHLTGLRPSPPRRVVGLRSERCGDTLCPGMNRLWRWVALRPVSDRSQS